MNPRARVIIDNDFAGDPDGLFQLAHHVLCSSVEVVQVIASRVPDAMLTPGQDFIADGVAAADEVLQLAGARVRTHRGAPAALVAGDQVAESATVRAIISEALRDDTDLPLFFAAGAGLTSLASALAIEPRIAERITLVWIGGHGYGDSVAQPEFNTSCDLVAAQIVFHSHVTIWQVPEPTYAQCLVSWTELDRDIAAHSVLGAHLVERWRAFTLMVEQLLGGSLGECAVLGDSPLVVLTALQGTFTRDASSSPSHSELRRPIQDDGSYGDARADLPPVRVFDAIDTRLLYGDLVAKLAAHSAALERGRS